MFAQVDSCRHTAMASGDTDMICGLYADADAASSTTHESQAPPEVLSKTFVRLVTDAWGRTLGCIPCRALPRYETLVASRGWSGSDQNGAS
jgi:hypothetical protein